MIRIIGFDDTTLKIVQATVMYYVIEKDSEVTVTRAGSFIPC